MRAFMTEEESRGRRGHNNQVRSDRDRGERRGAGQGGRDAESEGRSVGSDKELAAEMEEVGMPKGEQEGGEDTLTALPWVPQ